MDTLYIYKIKEHKQQIEPHLKHIKHELKYNIDKDIETILNIEVKYLESVLRIMNKVLEREK